MKKNLTVLLMLSLLVLLLSACADEQMEINPQKIEDVVQEVELEHIAEIEVAPTPESSPEPIQVVEVAKRQETTDDPKDRTYSTPAESPAPTSTPKQTQQQTPAATPKPTQSSESTQAPNQAAPTPQSIPKPVEQSTPTPQPTFQPKPELTPESNPHPSPLPVIIVTPPLSRTICNTCEVDITDSLVEHGTAHLINDENFSYRNE